MREGRTANSLPVLSTFFEPPNERKMTSPPSTPTTTTETKLASINPKPCAGLQTETNPDDRTVRLALF